MTTGPFSLSDAEELRAILTEATFKDITIHPAVKILRFPSPEAFVLQYAAGSALASAVAPADGNARAALMAEASQDCSLRLMIRGWGLRSRPTSSWLAGE